MNLDSETSTNATWTGNVTITTGSSTDGNIWTSGGNCEPIRGSYSIKHYKTMQIRLFRFPGDEGELVMNSVMI